MITSEEKEILLQRAKEILKKNWEDIDENKGYTKPSNEIYPFQWNWDVGFITYGYTHFDLDKAVKEYRALFSGQWKNGFLPHIIFHKPAPSYFPNADFWQSQELCKKQGSPLNIKTSGITQPPIHAMSIWHVYKALKRQNLERAINFLQEIYPKLYLNHEYFMNERDPEKTGAITIYHPWESGFDNSPRWDVPLARIVIENLIEYKRVDNKLIDPKFRPKLEYYDKYVYLVQKLKEEKYRDKKIRKKHPFLVKDVVTSSIMYLSNLRLKKMANELGEKTFEIDMWLKRFEDNFRDLFQDKDGFFYDLDMITGEKIKVRTAAALLPLITGLLNGKELKKIADEITQDGLVPSTDEKSPKFNPQLYWRGPIWINVNWLIWKGGMKYGVDLDTDSLRNKMIDLVKTSGFWEYFKPETHEGIGANNFSWTAALIIDLLSHRDGF